MTRSAARAARGPQKYVRGLQRWRKREVGKPSIECTQKLSDHAVVSVDWFLVSPGLTVRGSRSSQSNRFFFFFFAILIWEHPEVLRPPP